MGTRNLTIVKSDNKYVVAQYGQWDGYPEGNGVVLYNFVKDKYNVDMLKENICRCNYIDEKKYEQMIKNVDEKSFLKEYPQFSRNTGADILSLIISSEEDSINLFDTIDFIADSLFCEWAYVIDLDTNTFEVFKGFNKTELKENDRFFEFEDKSEREYHPCREVMSWKFDDLPDTEEDFLKLVDVDEDEQMKIDFTELNDDDKV